MSKTKTHKSKKSAGKNASKSQKKGKKPLNDKPVLPEQKAEVKISPVAEPKKEEKQEPKTEPKKEEVKKSTDEVVGKKSKRDFSLFKFNGVEYNKGRLVHAIIKQYAHDKKPTFAQLKEAFPDEVIKPYGYGLFRIFSEAKAINDESKRVRFFVNVKAGEEIKLKDKTIAVTNQMTGDLLGRFLEIAKKHKYVVK